MFKRIIYEDWTTIVPIISFCLTFGVFAATAVRAALLPKEKRERLAAMPLDAPSTRPIT